MNAETIFRYVYDGLWFLFVFWCGAAYATVSEDARSTINRQLNRWATWVMRIARWITRGSGGVA